MNLTELIGSFPSCAQNCTTDSISKCVFEKDLDCFCHESEAADQSCLFESCAVKDVMFIAEATKTTCGQEPYVNHKFLPIFITFLAGAAVFVILRWIARVIMGMKLWWDDFLNFAAYLCCIAYTVYGMMLKPGGFGTETWAIPYDNIKTQLMGYYVMALVYFMARFLVRLSILFFYLRIFRASHTEKIIKATLAATVIVFVPLYLAAVFQCKPISYIWDRIDAGANGQCFRDRDFLKAALSLLLINDFWILIMPIPLIVRLQLSWRKRLLVVAMFGMGIGVIITSIYKMTLIEEYIDLASPTTNVVNMSIWAGVEINLGVIFACLPSMPALFQPLMSRLSGSSRASKSRHNYGGSRGLSRYDMLDKPNISLPASVASRETGKQIRLTTTIQQNFHASESQTYLPMHHPDGDKDAIELGDTRKGITRAKAWA